MAETKFSNPIGDNGAMDPTVVSTAVFDDDAARPAERAESTDSYTQDRVNAHNVQQFVGEQSKPCMYAGKQRARASWSSCQLILDTNFHTSNPVLVSLPTFGLL